MSRSRRVLSGEIGLTEMNGRGVIGMEGAAKERIQKRAWEMRTIRTFDLGRRNVVYQRLLLLENGRIGRREWVRMNKRGGTPLAEGG